MELALSAARSDCDRQDRPRAAIYAHGGEPPEPGARMRRADSRVRKRGGAGIKRTLTEGEGFEPSVPVDPGTTGFKTIVDRAESRRTAGVLRARGGLLRSDRDRLDGFWEFWETPNACARE